MPTFYFGRGSSDCIYVKDCPGCYFEVGIGNTKTSQIGNSMRMDHSEMYRLSMFFMAMWQEYGQRICVEPILDDPHDSIYINDFDFSQAEK